MNSSEALVGQRIQSHGAQFNKSELDVVVKSSTNIMIFCQTRVKGKLNIYILLLITLRIQENSYHQKKLSICGCYVKWKYKNMLKTLTMLKKVIRCLVKVFQFILFLFRKQARQIIQRQVITYENINLNAISMQRLAITGRKILVLDLDETLIHSHHDGIVRPMVKPGTPPDFILRVTIDRHPVRFFVYKRPHVDYFLSIVSRWFDLVIFTASMEVYGSAVADRLDQGRGMLNRRYYRQHCTIDYGGYTKDISSVSSDLSSVCILDNSPGAYRLFPDNAIPIKSWFTDPTDIELLKLLPFLDSLRFCVDVRSILSRSSLNNLASR
ncbi:CTD nuclear envelope phosphatase 1 [Trichinella spiralis]|uniref:CTD nuclear envelope phosphatase 1 homolog n=5 Tax=Trichinella TaxID=6333 RepID=A0A0V1BIA6_TRISP|nr:CTD nuclear envelope phosphatase 1 [Trichinella spiralis]